jgi:hypothetical protein
MNNKAAWGRQTLVAAAAAIALGGSASGQMAPPMMRPMPPPAVAPPGTLATICRYPNPMYSCAMWVHISRAHLPCTCSPPGVPPIFGYPQYIGWVNPPLNGPGGSPRPEPQTPDSRSPPKGRNLPPPTRRVENDDCFNGLGNCTAYGIQGPLRR